MNSPGAAFDGVHCPFCDWQGESFLPAGRARRPNRRCPRCGSLERHRLIAAPLARCCEARPPLVIVEIGPQDCVHSLLRDRADVRWVTVDIDRPADVRANVTALPFAIGSVDVIVCLHVIEHVADDVAALCEIRRVLSRRGVVVVQVPEQAGETLDGRVWSPDERDERLGHREHRWGYGSGEFEARLRSAGLRTRRWPDPGEVSSKDSRRLGLRPGQTVHVGTRDDGDERPLLSLFTAAPRGRATR